MVIFRFPGSEPITCTTPPARSISQASSVACDSSSSDASASARSSAARRNTCGVWTAHSRARSSVRVTERPSSPTSLIVSDTGVAAITASASGVNASASSAWVNRSGVASGRAASCTITGSAPATAAASAARTDWERWAPPATAITPSGARVERVGRQRDDDLRNGGHGPQ